MATAAYKKAINLSIDGGAFSEIPDLTDASVSFGGEVLDITTFKSARDDSGARKKMYGLRDASVSFSGNFDTDSTEVEAMVNNWLGDGKVLTIKYYPMGDSLGTEYYFEFDFLVESFETSGSVDGVEEMSLSLQSTGAITYDNA